MTEHRRIKGDPRLGFRSAATCEDCGKELDEGTLCDSCEQARRYDAASDPSFGEIGTSISFAGEACEAFADWIGSKAGKGYYVRLTTLTGQRFDAVLVDNALDTKIDGDTWFDAVTYLPADPETGLAIEGELPRAVRVSEVFVY